VVGVDLIILDSILIRGVARYKLHLFREEKNNFLYKNIVFYVVLLT